MCAAAIIAPIFSRLPSQRVRLGVFSTVSLYKSSHICMSNSLGFTQGGRPLFFFVVVFGVKSFVKQIQSTVTRTLVITVRLLCPCDGNCFGRVTAPGLQPVVFVDW